MLIHQVVVEVVVEVAELQEAEVQAQEGEIHPHKKEHRALIRVNLGLLVTQLSHLEHQEVSNWTFDKK